MKKSGNVATSGGGIATVRPHLLFNKITIIIIGIPNNSASKNDNSDNDDNTIINDNNIQQVPADVLLVTMKVGPTLPSVLFCHKHS